jgi:hypothetical protein
MKNDPDEKITVVFSRRQAERVLKTLDLHWDKSTGGTFFSAKRTLMKALGVWKEKTKEQK